MNLKRSESGRKRFRVMSFAGGVQLITALSLSGCQTQGVSEAPWLALMLAGCLYAIAQALLFIFCTPRRRRSNAAPIEPAEPR